MSGNPPYVTEAGNKVLFDRLRALPGWRGDYHGKGDYFYYFLAMAAEKLAQGGRLCVITPASWMNAGNAGWLRERLAATLRLDELYLFGRMRLFATEESEREVRAGMTPPLVESSILIATRTPREANHRLRVVVLEDEAAAAAALTGNSAQRAAPRDGLLGEMARRADGRAGRAKGILVHDVSQRDLRSARPWPIKHRPQDVASRVVAHLQTALASEHSPVEPLADRWVVASGIETGADAYTAKLQRRLDDDTRSRAASKGLRTGDPILQLPPGRERTAPWSYHPEALARAPEARAILYGAIDDDDYTSLVWLGRDAEPAPAILDALEPWRDVLSTRAEFARNPRRRWWETAWPRDRLALRGPKVIALHRTDHGRFAVDESGHWQAAKNATTVTARGGALSVAYLCGLLNSELLDLWYALRGRTPRDVWRDYEPKPMNQMPYRHVVPPLGWFPGADVAALEEALGVGDVDSALEAAIVVGAAAGSPAGDANAAAAIEGLVRAIAVNRRALLPLRSIAPELRRAVKNPWRTRGVSVDQAAVLAGMPPAMLRTVRLDSELSVTVVTDGVLGRSSMKDGALVFTHARKVTAQVEGPPERLTLLMDLLGSARLLALDLPAAMMPASLDVFAAEVVRCQNEIDGLLDVGRRLVEATERLVCKIYAVPDSLADQVVASAVTRSDTVAQVEA